MVIIMELIVRHCLEEPCCMLMMAVPDVEISMVFACLQRGSKLFARWHQCLYGSDESAEFYSETHLILSHGLCCYRYEAVCAD